VEEVTLFTMPAFSRLLMACQGRNGVDEVAAMRGDLDGGSRAGQVSARAIRAD